jgi:hypothetical protein
MIIPVAFRLTREDAEESFDVDTDKPYLIAPPFTKVKVEIDFIDVATGRGHGLSGTLLTDATERNAYHSMGERRAFYSLVDTHKRYLRELRAEINQALEEERTDEGHRRDGQ